MGNIFSQVQPIRERQSPKVMLPRMAVNPSNSENSLELLQLYLGLIPGVENGDKIDDVVFIAIDFENTSSFEYADDKDRKSQVGLAILDTRGLVSSPKEATIVTCNFVTGPEDDYCTKSSNRFVFGNAVKICQQEIRENLESLILPERNNVLVGHALENEIRVLDLLKFDFRSLFIGTLDTQDIAALMVPPLCHMRRKPALSELLGNLKCPHAGLHNAANDAHFTLRALLMMATRICRHTTILDAEVESKLKALETLTQKPLPFRKGLSPTIVLGKAPALVVQRPLTKRQTRKAKRKEDRLIRMQQWLLNSKERRLKKKKKHEDLRQHHEIKKRLQTEERLDPEKCETNEEKAVVAAWQLEEKVKARKKEYILSEHAEETAQLRAKRAERRIATESSYFAAKSSD